VGEADRGARAQVRGEVIAVDGGVLLVRAPSIITTSAQAAASASSIGSSPSVDTRARLGDF
jgi:hypothetical protein